MVDLMYSRYNNPADVLGHFSTDTVGWYLLDIITREQEKEQEDYLFNVWLHKVWDGIDYGKWKKSVIKQTNKATGKLTDEQAEKNIEKANAILGVEPTRPGEVRE